MIRKLLVAIIFTLIFVFIGFIVWLFFFKETPESVSYTPPERSEDFFPVNFDNGIGEQGILSPDGQNQTELINRNLIPRLRQLSQVPVAGSVAFERQGGSSRRVVSQDGSEQNISSNTVIFRYVERATGHLYEAREDSLTQTRLSNTTIPRVLDATFTPEGERVLLKISKEDQETIETLSAKVTSKSTTSPATFRLEPDGFSLEGTFLPQNIISSDISKEGLTYIIENSSGGSSLITSTFDDLSKKIIYSSPLSGWIIDRIGNNTLITNKADSRVSGFSYLINNQNGTENKLLGDITGLTTLISPDQKWIIYSLSRQNELDTYALNTETDRVTKLGFDTLPEKCVFSSKQSEILFCGASTQTPRASFPESWYQGLVGFNDNIWKINLEEESYDQIMSDQEEVDQSFDIIKPTLSPDDRFILFINKKDLTLWSLEI